MHVYFLFGVLLCLKFNCYINEIKLICKFLQKNKRKIYKILIIIIIIRRQIRRRWWFFLERQGYFLLKQNWR